MSSSVAQQSDPLRQRIPATAIADYPHAGGMTSAGFRSPSAPPVLRMDRGWWVAVSLCAQGKSRSRRCQCRPWTPQTYWPEVRASQGRRGSRQFGRGCPPSPLCAWSQSATSRWSERPDSNRRPLDPQSSALPDCATLRHSGWDYTRAGGPQATALGAPRAQQRAQRLEFGEHGPERRLIVAGAGGAAGRAEAPVSSCGVVRLGRLATPGAS